MAESQIKAAIRELFAKYPWFDHEYGKYSDSTAAEFAESNHLAGEKITDKAGVEYRITVREYYNRDSRATLKSVWLRKKADNEIDSAVLMADFGL